jgi:hypothetical protein
VIDQRSESTEGGADEIARMLTGARSQASERAVQLDGGGVDDRHVVARLRQLVRPSPALRHLSGP